MRVISAQPYLPPGTYHKGLLPMIYEFLYALLIYGIFSYYRPSTIDSDGEKLQKKIKAHYSLSLVNPGHLQPWHSENASEEFLQELIKKAYFSAQAVQTSLFALLELLEAAQVGYRTKIRFLQLIKIRITLFCGIAMLGRTAIKIIFLQQELPPHIARWDALLMLLSLALIAGGLTLIKRLLPDDWLWQGGFTPTGQQWLRYRMLDTSFGDEPLGRQLKELMRQQVIRGIYLGRERLQVLRFYCREQRKKIEHRNGNFAESLPLIDLFVVGIPAGLLLVVPGLVALSKMGTWQ